MTENTSSPHRPHDHTPQLSRKYRSNPANQSRLFTPLASSALCLRQAPKLQAHPATTGELAFHMSCILENESQVWHFGLSATDRGLPSRLSAPESGPSAWPRPGVFTLPPVSAHLLSLPSVFGYLYITAVGASSLFV